RRWIVPDFRHLDGLRALRKSSSSRRDSGPPRLHDAWPEEDAMAHIARLVVWPFVVTLTSAGFALGFATGQPVVALMLVPVAVTVLLIAMEQWWPAVVQGSALDDPEARRDMVHTVVGQGFGNQLGEAIGAGALAVFAGWVGTRADIALWPTSWPLALQVL